MFCASDGCADYFSPACHRLAENSPFQMLLSTLMCQGWGGCVSDKHVTDKSCLLNKLLTGDLVLADRGFDIRDHVGLCVCRSENTCIHKRMQRAGCKRCGENIPNINSISSIISVL